MKQAVLIYRAERYSPSSEEADRAIMQAVGKQLAAKGYQNLNIDEDQISIIADLIHPSDIVLTMARSQEALSQLDEMAKRGISIVNSPSAIRSCSRSRLNHILRENSIPIPSEQEGERFWIKRGDQTAQTPDDVVFCPDKDALNKQRQLFAARGVTDIVVQTHIEGDLVKFYGVGQSRFFEIYYPDNDGFSKFGNEQINGKPNHYDFDRQRFTSDAQRISHLTGTIVYGGDAIITSEGKWYFIDFNDWPSFRRCRDKAAEAVAQEIEDTQRMPKCQTT